MCNLRGNSARPKAGVPMGFSLHRGRGRNGCCLSLIGRAVRTVKPLVKGGEIYPAEMAPWRYCIKLYAYVGSSCRDLDALQRTRL